MRARFLIPALFAFLAHVAHAAPACPPSEPWQCIGSIELATSDGTFRMTFFDNDELLAEIERGDTRRRMLATQAGATLYAGVPVADIGVPTRNPFTMFQLGFGPAISALRDAFPAGPASVPVDKVTKHASMGGSHATVEARRDPDGSVAFAITSQAMPYMRGRLSRASPRPWADDIDISQWTTERGERYRRLGDVRRRPGTAVRPD